jgi:hypothetical protein
MWEDNIKMYFKEIGCEDIDWIQLAQDIIQCHVLVNTVINLFPQKEGNFILC